ncbi:MAG: acetylxylan esterase [Clostridia bacterium]|nr:acetylxylan esterase [Clostridia bacterium]
MQKRKILTAVFLLVFTLLLCSCFGSGQIKDKDGSLTLFDKQMTRHTVIIPNNSSSELVSAALSVARLAENTAGVLPNVVVDRELPFTESAYEILIGKTDRTIPDTLLPDGPLGYVIGVHDNSVVIIGGTDTATVNAVEYFIENALTSSTVVLENNYFYRYTHVYTDVTVNGEKVTSFELESFENADTKKISEAIEKTTGIYCNGGESSIKISFALDYTLENNTLRISETDGNILISASSKVAMTMIDEVIAEGFPYYEIIELSDGSYIDLTYPALSVLDLPESFEKYFYCETNKPPMEYDIGEEMIFTLSLRCDGEAITSPGFYYELEFDGDKKKEYGNINTTDTSFEIKTSLDTPGFVKLYVAATSNKTVEFRGISPFNGGAGAAVGLIKQAVAEPEDFDEFWAEQLALLDEVPPVMEVKKDISEDYPGYKVTDIRIDCVGGPVSAYLAIPENAKPKSLGILVGYTGYGVISPEPAVRSDKIVLTVNAHSLDNGREAGYYSEVSNTVLYSYGFNTYENSKRDTVYFKNMILRDIQAIRYLKTLEEFDGKSITLNGGSQGAYQAVAVAALDPDITYLFGAYTWLCDLGGAYAGRISGWRPDHTDALNYYDAINFAKRIKCECRIDAGLGDYTSPPSSVTAMVNSMSAPVEFNMTQGMTHFYTPPEAETFTAYK